MHGPATIGFMNMQSEVAKQQRIARAMNAPKHENGKGEVGVQMIQRIVKKRARKS